MIEYKKIILVPVEGAPLPDAPALQTYLNNIYKSANVVFTVETKPNFTFDLGTGANAGLERSDESMFGKYSLEMRALKSAYMAFDANYDKKASYIFVVPSFSGTGDLKGFMVRGRSVGFVVPDADMRTYAHELGHGIFGLEHTFPEVAKQTTNNLMDYGVGTRLTHEQWKIIHARKPAYSWFDSEEDGSEYTGGYFKIGDVGILSSPTYTLTNVSQSGFINFVTPNGQIVQLPNTTTVSFAGGMVNKGTNTRSVYSKNGVGVLTSFYLNSVQWRWSYTINNYKNTTNQAFSGVLLATPQMVIIGVEESDCQVTLYKGTYTPTSTSNVTQILLPVLTSELIGFKLIAEKDCERKGTVLFKEKQLTIDYNNLSASDKIVEKGLIENLIYKLRPTGCIVIEGEGTGNYAVIPDGNTNIQVIPALDSADKALLAKNYGKGNMIANAVDVAQQLTKWYEKNIGPLPQNTPVACTFCPSNKTLDPLILPIVQTVYNNAGQTDVACDGLILLCRETDFSTNIAMAQALAAFADTPNGATKAQKLNAFFNDITGGAMAGRLRPSQTTQHIFWFTNADFGADQINAWQKLYGSNFEWNFEYIRTLSYKGLNGNRLVVDMTTCTTSTISPNNITITSNDLDNIVSISFGKLTIISTAGSTVADARCNDMLNVHPLLQIEDAEYIIDGRYKYITDAQGRVKQITGELLSPTNPPASPRERNADQQTYLCNALKDGTQGADDGGHMIAKELFGASEQINYFPQTSNVNRPPGDWRTMEREWKAVLQGNRYPANTNLPAIVQAGTPQSVEVDITPVFLEIVKDQYALK